jgi:hypothetical protein
MSVARFSLCLAVGTLCCQMHAGSEEPAKKAQVRTSKDFGLIFCYSAKQEPKDFLTSTPCVTGVSWRMTAQDEKHWIGELHYPTENTANYEKDAKDRSDQYYMVTNVAIRKQQGLPIDLTKFEGALVLRDPKPDVPLAMRGDGTSYELVGYEDKTRDDAAFNFLFATHPELRYAAPKKP